MFIDGAEAAFEKDTAIDVALEDEPLFFIGDGVSPYEIGPGEAKKPRDVFDIALLKAHGSLAAAVGALGTVDLILDVLSDAAELAFDEFILLEVLAQALIFGALARPQPVDLNQVRNHCL